MKSDAMRRQLNELIPDLPADDGGLFRTLQSRIAKRRVFEKARVNWCSTDLRGQKIKRECFEPCDDWCVRMSMKEGYTASELERIAVESEAMV